MKINCSALMKKYNYIKIALSLIFISLISCSDSEQKVCEYVNQSIELLSKESLSNSEFEQLVELEEKISKAVKKSRKSKGLDEKAINYENLLETHNCEEVFSFLN